MKRSIVILVLILFLSGCGKTEDAEFRYDETDFVYEVNQQQIDYMQHIYTKHEVDIDDSKVDFGVIGEYILYVTDLETNIDYEIPIIVEDNTAPEITVPETFKRYYEPGATVDLSEIMVLDNSREMIEYTTNLDQINMNQNGEKVLVITAEDKTGNLTVKEVKFYVRQIIYPEINITVYNVSNTSFTVRFEENDPLNYKVESSYSLLKGEEIIQEGEVGALTIDFTDLLQDTEYEIVYYYTFLVPGESQKVTSMTVFVETASLFTPVIQLDNVLISSDSLSFDVLKIDPDQLLGDIQVTVKNQHDFIVLQRLLGDNPGFALTDLNLSEEYTIILSFSYDLSDGRGIQQYVEEYTYQILD